MPLLPPIAVLADDFSGAAEIAGVARRMGLSADVAVAGDEPSQAEVWCLDLHTRTGPADVAAQRTAVLAAAAAKSGRRLFKKTDSLLRGHVRTEIEAILRATGAARAALCPANPGRGRTIAGGRYFVNGRLLAETPLAADPDFPRTTSDVRALLGPGELAVDLPDLPDSAALTAIASSLSAEALPAGGAEFFAALLLAGGAREQPLPPIALPAPWLLVCGSAAAWQARRAEQARQHGLAVVTLEAGAERAAAVAARQLTGRGVLLAIGAGWPGETSPRRLEQALAEAAVAAHTIAPAGTLLLEGGATARAVLDRGGWSHFAALGEIGAGAVALQAPAAAAPRVVVKPGSYPWPAEIWDRLSFPPAIGQDGGRPSGA